jgi:hypothetical protein
MASKPTTTPRGRDSRNGQFKPIAWAKAHPKISEVERVPTSGNSVIKKK